VYQVNAKVPHGVAAGTAVPVEISMGNIKSNTVTIAVGPLVLNPAPSITSLSPSSTSAGSGPLTLTINGAGFVHGSTVTFSGSPRAVSFVSSIRLAINLSAADLASAGSFAVVVTNPPPGGGSSNVVDFTVTTPLNPQPSISSISPTTALARSAPLTLTVNGTGFNADSMVAFAGLGHGITLISTSVIQTTLSAEDLATAGNYPVFVVNPPPGGGASNTVLFNVTTPAPVGLMGAWQGSWSSSVYPVNGTLAADLIQAGNTLTGTVVFGGSPCFIGGSLSGTINGSSLSATLNVGGGQTISLTATVNGGGTSISGNYTLQGGTCAPSGDSGNFSITLAGPIQTSFTGSWQGMWESISGLVGSISASLTQNGTALTGTVHFAGSPCFTDGNVAGTVIGNAVSATLDVGGGQTISLTAIAVTRSIDGIYTLQGGTCAPLGDSGSFSMTRSP
jgi:hypothetical protein